MDYHGIITFHEITMEYHIQWEGNAVEPPAIPWINVIIMEYHIQWEGSAAEPPGIPWINVIIMKYHIQGEGNAVEPPRIPGALRWEEPRASSSWCKNH